MSDTPRTDELAKRDFVPDGLWIKHGRELERELNVANNWVEHHQNHCDDLMKENSALRELTSTLGAPNHINIPVEKWHELRADKERLDWLSSQKDQPWLYWERPLRLTREAIDAFRKEAQP